MIQTSKQKLKWKQHRIWVERRQKFKTNKRESAAKTAPIQHSILAQGDIFITSGGSTLMFKHKTRATYPVFICTKSWELNQKTNTCKHITPKHIEQKFITVAQHGDDKKKND